MPDNTVKTGTSRLYPGVSPLSAERLAELKRPFLNMSPEEQLEFVRALRAKRSKRPEAKIIKQPKPPKPPKAPKQPKPKKEKANAKKKQSVAAQEPASSGSVGTETQSGHSDTPNAPFEESASAASRPATTPAAAPDWRDRARLNRERNRKP